jgi:hypothetical protein
LSPNHPRFYGIWVNVHHPNYPSRLYIQDDLHVSLNNKRLLVEGESHIQPTGVQTPDTERVSTRPPDTERVSAHKSTGGEKGRGEKGEGPRTAETWFVSRHYEPRTEV